MEFSRLVRGTCCFCGNDDMVIYGAGGQERRVREPVGVCDSLLAIAAPSSPAVLGLGEPVGFCDVCSYALRHAWQKAQGERIVAVSPPLVRTYVLVPRLKKNREPSDITGYDFLVGMDDRIPFFDHVKPGELLARLSKGYGVATWEETTRKCYLGYDGRADFSEVVLAWSWGKEIRSPHKNTFSDFEHLLAVPSADAGFYLGVKAAFEALLWRAEVEGDDGPLTLGPLTLCVPLRESAMRYLAAQRGSETRGSETRGETGDDEEADYSMVEIYRSAMSPEEIRVVGLITRESSTQVTASRVSDPRVSDPRVSDPRAVDSQVEDLEQGSLEATEKVEGVVIPETTTPTPTLRPSESIAPGYARVPSKIRTP